MEQGYIYGRSMMFVAGSCLEDGTGRTWMVLANDEARHTEQCLVNICSGVIVHHSKVPEPWKPVPVGQLDKR